MTIDPQKFEQQGKPTVDQVRTVWEAHPAPSSRKVADLLARRGFSISWRTIARWHKNGWAAEGSAKPQPAKTGAEGIKDAVVGGGLTDDDYARIEKRKKELTKMTPAQLLMEQEKARTIMNIVVMEEATRRAHIMALIPKDTGSFLADAADAAKAAPAMAPIEPPDQHLNGSGAKLVEHNAVIEMSPLSAAIRKIKAEASA